MPITNPTVRAGAAPQAQQQAMTAEQGFALGVVAGYVLGVLLLF